MFVRDDIMKESIQQLDYLFTPRSVAVIGASNNPSKWSFDTFRCVLKGQENFRVYPINKRDKEVFGVKAYENISQVPEPVDFAVMVIPPQFTPEAMKDCGEKGVKAVLMISAGFKEAGVEGAQLQEEVVSIARQYSIRIVGPNCNGHFDTHSGLHTLGLAPLKGQIALVSQSGNFGGHIVSEGREKGIGFSKYVSSGNEADVTIEDYIEYLAEDDQTQIICAYVEGFKDARRFFKLARETTRKKPIILMKVGRTEEGAQAAMSHTASLSGSDAVHDAALQQCGVIRVDKVGDMIDIASALIRQPIPKGNRVGIVTIGGGFGVVATDACRRLGLEIPNLSDKTIQRLNTLLPPRWSHGNPVDMTAVSDTSYSCIGALLKDEEIDAVMAIGCMGFVPGIPEGLPKKLEVKLQEHNKMMMEGELSLLSGLVERIDKRGKPLIITAVSKTDDALVLKELARQGFYTYQTPEAGAQVLAYLAKYSRYLSQD